MMDYCEFLSGFGKVFEAGDRFGINLFGKRQPNMTFLVPTQGLVVSDPDDVFNTVRYLSPLRFLKGSDEVDVLFGDFWVSKKGGPCFAPKDPAKSKHVILKYEVGFLSKDPYEEFETMYVSKSTLNASSLACRDLTYRVLNVGSIPDDMRLKCAELFNRENSEAIICTRKYEQVRQESLAAKPLIIDRIRDINDQLRKLEKGQYSRYFVRQVTVSDYCYYLDSKWHSFNEPIDLLEKYFVLTKEWVESSERKYAFEKAQRDEFLPRFEALRDDVELLGWSFSAENEYVRIDRCRYEYSDGGVAKLCEVISCEKESRAAAAAQAEIEQRKAEAEAEAKKLGLPGDIRLWHRNGATNAGKAWVIRPDGSLRECDFVDTMVCGSNSKKYHQSYEGDHVWNQILPGELVLYWSHAFTAAPHDFSVIYHPGFLTEAQVSCVVEIQNELEDAFFGALGLTGSRSCPSIGAGWGLV